jgi:pyruvate ferredoxin oxidoreductase beta subunit
MSQSDKPTPLRLKDLSYKPEGLQGGHRLCSGCAASVIARQVLLAVDDPVVIANATGCLEVATTIYPWTAWSVPWIHNAFENAAATISGVESMYRVLKRRGKIPEDKNIKFIAIGGDGGTYDIGLQSLSGAMERGHAFLYICYDNGAYMNTGVQRSGSTPFGAATSTTPVGSVQKGKQQFRKDLTSIAVAHHVPFVAQASPSHWRDLMQKVRTALDKNAPTFINTISVCDLGWKTPPADTIEIARVAIDTCHWPLYEVNEGKYKLNHKPREKKPIEEFLKLQGRFRHLLRPENSHLVEEIQIRVDHLWENLLAKCAETSATKATPRAKAKPEEEKKAPVSK